MTRSSNSTFLGAAGLVILVAIVAGVRVLGSPTEERALRLDDRRVAELQAIAAATDLFWTRNEELPESLAALTEEAGVQVSVLDPASGTPYVYSPREGAAYELCATFERDTRDRMGSPRDDLWRHGPGYACFALEAETVERTESRR